MRADRFGSSLEPAGIWLSRLRGFCLGAAADILAHRKADEPGVAAHGTTPLRALAVWHIRAASRLRVQLLERPILAASGAVPGHRGDLLGAVQPECAAVEIRVAADSDMTVGRFVGSRAACLEGATALCDETIPDVQRSYVRRSET